MRALLIHNPTAGQRNWDTALHEVGAHLRSLGWQLTVRQTAQRGDATTFARAAVAERLDVVLVAGGDGTINEALNSLAHSAVALGVLPIGTANVWAQEIGLPVPRLLDPDPNPLLTGVKQLCDGVVYVMDLGQVNDRYFMLYGSVGFDAHIVREMEARTDLKQQIGGLAYYIAGAAAAWQFRGTRATLAIDGKRIRRRIWAVMAGNTQLYGGVMRVAPDALADDGLLDIVVVEGHGPLATLRHYAGFILRGIWTDSQIELFRARTVEITTQQPMPVQVDGDAAGVSPITIRVVPAALRVLVPRGAPLRIFAHTNSNPLAEAT
ncbi:MAG: diacylglycerol kinase family protein [Chloroflexota bacterium]